MSCLRKPPFAKILHILLCVLIILQKFCYYHIPDEELEVHKFQILGQNSNTRNDEARIHIDI